MISGWAVDPNAIYRYQVDAAFPLSDHADYTDLLRYVELVNRTACSRSTVSQPSLRAICATAAWRPGP